VQIPFFLLPILKENQIAPYTVSSEKLRHASVTRMISQEKSQADVQAEGNKARYKKRYQIKRAEDYLNYRCESILRQRCCHYLHNPEKRHYFPYNIPRRLQNSLGYNLLSLPNLYDNNFDLHPVSGH
jgi:hypothetical protein